MFQGRQIEKRRRTARVAVEALEDRVELAAGGLAPRATAMVDRLGHRLRVQVQQIGAHLDNRIARFNRAYQVALRDAAGHGVAEARALPGPTIGEVHRHYDNLVRNTNRSVNAMVGHFRDVALRHPALTATIRGAGPGADRIEQAVSGVGASLKRQARGARAAAGSVVGPTHAAIVRARNSPASAMGRVSGAEAALSQLTRSEVASNQAAVRSFLDAYDSALSDVHSELAALPQGGASIGSASRASVRRAHARARGLHVGRGYAGLTPGGLLGGTGTGLGAMSRAGFGRLGIGALTFGRLRYGLTGFGSPTQGLAGNYGTAGMGAAVGSYGTSDVGTYGNGVGTQGFAGSYGNAGVGPIGFGSPTQGLAGNFGTAGASPGYMGGAGTF